MSKATQSSERIRRRKDVYPKRGKHEYGDVKFADPVNNKYPIDTPPHIRAAWSYINLKHPYTDFESALRRRPPEEIKTVIEWTTS